MKSITGILLLLFVTTIAFSQKTYTVTETEKSMYKGTHPALTMTFEGVSVKVAEDEWKGFIKSYKGKTKEDKKGKVWFTDDAKLEKVSENTIDLYTSFTEVPGGTNVSVWFDLGGAYLSSGLERSKTEEAKKVLQNYGHAISKYLAKEDWDMQVKNLDEMGKSLKKMQGTQSDLQKKIEELKAEMMTLEAELQQNLSEQQNQQNVMKAQEKAVESAKSLYKKH